MWQDGFAIYRFMRAFGQGHNSGDASLGIDVSGISEPGSLAFRASNPFALLGRRKYRSCFVYFLRNLLTAPHGTWFL